MGKPYLLEFNGALVNVKEYCELVGISYKAVQNKKHRTNDTYENIIAYYLNHETGGYIPKINLDGQLLTLKECCKIKNLSYKAVSEYKRLHKDIEYDELFKFYEIKKEKSYRRLYIIWHNMKERCYNVNHCSYKNYGGRGIIVCDRWQKFIYFCNDMYDSYQQHVKDFGEKNTTLDRINTNKIYCLDNCRWATIQEQVNNRRNTIRLDNGELLTDYCKKNGLNYRTVINRLLNGWTLDEAINVPIQEKYRHKNK